MEVDIFHWRVQHLRMENRLVADIEIMPFYSVYVFVHSNQQSANIMRFDEFDGPTWRPSIMIIIFVAIWNEFTTRHVLSCSHRNANVRKRSHTKTTSYSCLTASNLSSILSSSSFFIFYIFLSSECVIHEFAVHVMSDATSWKRLTSFVSIIHTNMQNRIFIYWMITRISCPVLAPSSCNMSVLPRYVDSYVKIMMKFDSISRLKQINCQQLWNGNIRIRLLSGITAHWFLFSEKRDD